MADPIDGGNSDASSLLPLALVERGNLGVTDLLNEVERLKTAQQPEQVIALYRAWLLNTRSPLAYAISFNLGVTLADAKDMAGAEEAYRQALRLKADFIPAHLNLGTLLESRGRKEEALAQWREVLKLDSAALTSEPALHLQALNNLGRLLEINRQFEEAEQMLLQSLTLETNQPHALQHWIHLRQKQCKWPIYSDLCGIPAEQMQLASSALSTLSLFDDPALQLAAARRLVADKVTPLIPALSNKGGYAHSKLRIGYLSSDFCLHPVALLTVELFELHDRGKFEIYGFCSSPEDGSALRSRVIQAMDHFVRINDMDDEAAAHAIFSCEIDILVDLQGLTSGVRPNIFSYRPAPVQVAWLGYPGTTAHPAIDYVIGDEFVLPENLEAFFTEKPIRMPVCFQPSDRQREIAALPGRADFSLPDGAFVYCCFNNNYKFTPEVFAAWMRILHRVPDSVLWLLADNSWARENLLKAAEQQGIESSRLIFAARVAPPDYLARYRLADLFLDTSPFNAGTTANDALWMGLPVLTCSGRSFASRMAGSLLNAVGLAALITYNLQDYENKAVSLANDREKMLALRHHLYETRKSSSLFDISQFVKDLEGLLQDIVARPTGPSMTKPSTRFNPIKEPGTMQLPPHVPLDSQQQTRVINLLVQTVWGLTDPVRFYEIMDEALKLVVPGYYLGDNLLTWGRNNSLFDDESFRIAWESNVQNDADRAIAWRRYILACAAYHCSQLPGDFVECGVYRGTGIKTVIDYFGNKGFTKTFWGYDTFDYNPIESHSFPGQEDGLFDEIQKRFEGYDQVRLVRGLLPGTLKDISPEKICYLHIDLNNANYEIAVLEELFDRVVPGGIIILDDYEWSGIYREQKIAEDAWFAQFNYRVFPLPTGQGLVLKR